MISIIICSRTATISGKLQANIEETIGRPFELIVIDNSKNNLSIFEAYRLGVHRSKGSILCFMHDDIFFHSNNWGETVVRHFDDSRTGAIGIAGSPYATKTIGSWWGGKLVNQNLIENIGQKKLSIKKYSDDMAATSKPVAVLDGVWMCIRKDLFYHVAFDSDNFKGFHFYDIDISLQILNLNYNLYCVFDIDIEHYSNGKVDEQWIKNALIFHKKWKSLLPVSATSMDEPAKIAAELETLKEFTRILIANGFSKRHSYSLALKNLSKFSSPISVYKHPKYFLYFLWRFAK